MYVSPQSITSSTTEIESLMERVSGEMDKQRRDAGLDRWLCNQKRQTELQQGLKQLKEQHDKMGSSSWYQFAVDMFLSIAQIALSLIGLQAPSSGLAIAQQGFNPIGLLLRKSNPFTGSAQSAGLAAKKSDVQAAALEQKLNLAQERLKTNQDNQHTVQRRLEKALNDLQTAHEASLRKG